MIVPEFWAEARRRSRSRGKQITVRRWGWSDESPAAAEAMAAARADEALQRALVEPRLRRREPKVPYNGAEGLPIREEIVSRHGDAVVTRNSYGAKCLNVPDVLFGDIDFCREPSCGLAIYLFVAFAVASCLGAIQISQPAVAALMFLILIVGSIMAAASLARVVHGVTAGSAAKLERKAISQIQKFVDRSPGWGVRVYRSPGGVRFLATHAPFDPRAPIVAKLFQQVGVDPMYAVMCVKQNCFRARLTAKPWRCGMNAHLKPRPGVWPVAQERLAGRKAWLAEYDRLAADFAACSLIEILGSGAIHAQIAPVVKLHDDACQALAPGRPLA